VTLKEAQYKYLVVEVKLEIALFMMQHIHLFTSICYSRSVTRGKYYLKIDKAKYHIRFSNLLIKMKVTYKHTIIPLTLYPQRGSRDISDIPLRHAHFPAVLLILKEKRNSKLKFIATSCILPILYITKLC
jgi:hypothetical protein